MEIRSIAVDIDPTDTNSAALKYAISLAIRFDAEVVGVAADQPNINYVGVGGSPAALDLYAVEQEAVENQLKRAEEVFQNLVPAAVPRRWRSYVGRPEWAILRNACSADLIITAGKVASTFHEGQKLNLGEIVLAAGRPVIDVAASSAGANFGNIVIGWKDTREARRAVADALPLVRLAREVTAITVSENNYDTERESLDDLARWLERHGVKIRTDIAYDPTYSGEVLQNAAIDQGADLVVAGGYGHSRMREWLFGGVTRSLLQVESLNRMFSN